MSAYQPWPSCWRPTKGETTLIKTLMRLDRRRDFGRNKDVTP